METPCDCRKIITSLISRCSSQARTISLRRLGPIPSTSVSRSGWFSMTSSVSRPKAATIRAAITLPIPRISPEPRYFSIPSRVAGTTVG